jgi:SAM-dependent methyltransferase
VDRELRTTFDEVAELYDRARPTYPDELFDDLVESARVGPGARLLELGSGTGIATLPLARRGFELVCVELGAQLAAVARRKLAAFPTVEVVNTAFEAWTPPGRFDAVVAFASFHWLDPDVRYERCADALRPDGALAVVRPNHVLPPDGDAFFREVQADYEAVAPDDPKTLGGPPPPPEEAVDFRADMTSSGLFGDVVVLRRRWDVTYDADAYVDVLDTYSWNRALAEPDRRRLYDLIRRRIAGRPGGTVRKTYLATLTVGRRL